MIKDYNSVSVSLPLRSVNTRKRPIVVLEKKCSDLNNVSWEGEERVPLVSYGSDLTSEPSHRAIRKG